MIASVFYITISVIISTLTTEPKDNSYFSSPLNIPLSLSSNFGELRQDHFHSGIDIKTYGITGKKVFASAEGYIYRISISPSGFGKALYLRHSNGYSTVYCHLDGFTPEIEKFVKEFQYAQKSYSVNIFPDTDNLLVKKGQLIGFSGNSGSSGGPHLHFEIRESDSEKPVNPLLFDFDIKDDIKPVIEELIIFPLNHHLSNIGNSMNIDVTGNNGKYYPISKDDIEIGGESGIGIKAFDRINSSRNKLGIYSFTVIINDKTIFKYIMDGFYFNETRYVNSHIDYATYKKSNIYIERAFVLPNDNLSTYKRLINRGIYNFKPDSLYRINIDVSDVHDNHSNLTFNVRGKKADSNNIYVEAIDTNIVVMPFDQMNKFEKEDISVSIPSGALYDTLYFSYRKESGNDYMISDLHYICDELTPIQKAIDISIKPKQLLPGLESKMIIVKLDKEQNRSATSSSWEDGYVSAKVSSFGRYYIDIDTIAPEILSLDFTSDGDVSGRDVLKFKITDDFTGIKSYEPIIDGNWALFEYDQKNDLLIYKFDEEKITKGMKHSLILTVTDNTDNISTYECDFTW